MWFLYYELDAFSKELGVLILPIENTTIFASSIKLNSVALVRTRTIPTERPPPVGEVSANFCG